MQNSSGVRFIRVRGRIVPIRDKKPSTKEKIIRGVGVGTIGLAAGAAAGVATAVALKSAPAKVLGHLFKKAAGHIKMPKLHRATKVPAAPKSMYGKNSRVREYSAEAKRSDDLDELLRTGSTKKNPRQNVRDYTKKRKKKTAGNPMGYTSTINIRAS